jgi:pilus assembly protein CpaB
MNKNVLIAFGGAIIIAILVAVMMSAMLKGDKGGKKTADQTPRVEILVAAANIGIGQSLTVENVKWKTWPGDGTYPGLIVRKDKEKLSDAADGRTIRSIAMDEPVLKSAIVSGEGGFMAAKLAPGMRAVAIKTKPETMVGGFINPGDYVDVVLTYTARVTATSNDPALESEMQRLIAMNLRRFASETVVRNARVLGVDQRLTADEKSTGKVGKTVTIEVDERGAEIIALATAMGDLRLVLRSLGDDDIRDDGFPTVSDARVMSINKELFKELSQVEELSGTRRNNVRIYSGGNVTNIPTR